MSFTRRLLILLKTDRHFWVWKSEFCAAAFKKKTPKEMFVAIENCGLKSIQLLIKIEGSVSLV